MNQPIHVIQQRSLQICIKKSSPHGSYYSLWIEMRETKTISVGNVLDAQDYHSYKSHYLRLYSYEILQKLSLMFTHYIQLIKNLFTISQSAHYLLPHPFLNCGISSQYLLCKRREKINTLFMGT